jgi:hypothetical protein
MVGGVLLLDRTLPLKTEEAYPKLKACLLERGGKVVSENSPSQLVVKQGSLWGVMPKTAKKIVTVKLEADGDGTHVTCQSKLASDWKNITVVGCVLAFVLACICVWMASDLSAYTAAHLTGFWSGLIVGGGEVNLAAVQAFVNLTFGLAGFLGVVILLEIAVVAFVHSKIDVFAKEALNALS